MEHLLLKAATTAATDEGIFEAVISTATADRDGDIVEPDAMVAALAKWAGLGKLVPLAYMHTDEVIGDIKPETVQVKNGEVIAQGWVDQSTPRGEEVWRLVKTGTLSFSFGYLIPKGGAVKRPGGRFRIKELDIFEISAVPVGPANNDTRVLSFKSAEALRKEAVRVEREAEEARLPDDLPPAPEPSEPAREPVTVDDVVSALKSLPEEDRDTLRKALGVPEPKDPATLRTEATRVARQAEAAQLPELPADTQPTDPAPTAEELLAKELQDVKAQLAKVATGLEVLQKKAEEADKEPTARSADPLRQRSEELALEVASGGMSLREPPTQVKAKTPDLIPLDELKRQSRDQMLRVLSGIEEQ